MKSIATHFSTACSYLCLIFLSALFYSGTLFAQSNKHALIIGIDIYKPPVTALTETGSQRSWTNLDGCVNDASAMRDLVIAKYAFENSHIKTLFNAEASRDRIITELKSLVQTTKKGDVVFIFYAGHGSQMKNSLSKEADKKDETMVPADAWKKGVADIRDKELAVYFNQLIDKGVLLTVIFDSCHSGSIGRGNENFLNDPPKARYIEGSDIDAKDATEPARPEERGALIISAAQDFEFAKEHRDENNVAHGAFTLALLKALQQQSTDAPVNDIFNSLTAIMKYYGKTQEPVLAGTDERKNGTLFALPTGSIKNRFMIATSRVEARGIEMQGGFAFGLAEGVKLANNKDTLQIFEMKDANRSLAKVISGDRTKILPGTLFEVVNWASSKAPALKVYIPQSVSDNDLKEFAKTYQKVKSSKKIDWIKDISKSNPDKIFYIENGQWNYNDKMAGKVAMKDGFTAAAFQSSLGNARSVFLSLPPSTSLYQQISKSFEAYNNIQIVKNPNESQYSLMGVLNDENDLEYALVKSQVTLQDTTESLPARTDFITYEANGSNEKKLAETLSESAFKIAKIRDWLMLTEPKGQGKFPFTLDFTYYESDRKVSSDKVRVGDTLSVFFQEDKSTGGWKSNFKKRYIYVFSIDSKGNTNLLFPSIESGNTENRFPVTNSDGIADSRTHLADFIITPPMGADNYFMLTSEQAISNLSVFNQEGVLTRGPDTATKGEHNPLEDLLFTGSKTRNLVITPVTWSIYKKVLRTTE